LSTSGLVICKEEKIASVKNDIEAKIMNRKIQPFHCTNMLCAGWSKKKDMKKTIIVAIIYLSGSFFGYKYCKHNLISSGAIKTWTVGNRNFAIGLSIGSWLAVAAMGIVDLIHAFNNDTPATW